MLVLSGTGLIFLPPFDLLGLMLVEFVDCNYPCICLFLFTLTTVALVSALANFFLVAADVALPIDDLFILEIFRLIAEINFNHNIVVNR